MCFVKFHLKYNLLLLSVLIVGVTNGGKSCQAGKRKNVGKLPTVRVRRIFTVKLIVRKITFLANYKEATFFGRHEMDIKYKQQ